MRFRAITDVAVLRQRFDVRGMSVHADAPPLPRARASSRASASGRSSTGSRPRARPRRLRPQRRRRRARSRPRATSARSTRFAAALRVEAPRARARRGGRPPSRSPRWASASSGSSRAAGPGRGADPARRRHLRRLPARALRPGRPPLPLPVRQLHAVRAALHDRPLRSRTTAPNTTMAGFPLCADVPARVRGPGRPPLPRRADRLPRLRAAAVACRSRRRSRCSARGADPRGQGPRRLPPRLRRRERGGGRAAARAQAPRGEAVRR